MAVTAPAANTIVTAPATITISADAADSDGTIAKVAFYQGTTLLGTATQAPFAITWANAPAGSYNLTAVATDNHGASTTSAAVPIIVNATPTVALTSPANQAVLAAPTDLVLTADAADSDGTIAKVAFYQGQTLLGTASQAPYAFAWYQVPPGDYSLTAKATDNLGIHTTSAAVTLTVVPNQPPQVTLTSLQAGQAFVAPATVRLSADASDADGKVTKVAFYQDGSLLGTASQAPYVYDWSNVPAGTYAITAQATDNKGGVTTTPPLTVIVLAQMKGVFYIHPDHLGTPRLVTDDKNKVIWQNDPLGEPFGAALPDEDPDGDKIKFALNLRFPGQYFDQETGVHYNYYRDYDPSTGRYIQSDPIGLAGGINTYAYVEDGPLIKSDPKGLFGEFPGDIGPVSLPNDPSMPLNFTPLPGSGIPGGNLSVKTFCNKGRLLQCTSGKIVGTGLDIVSCVKSKDPKSLTINCSQAVVSCVDLGKCATDNCGVSLQ
ncbi:MAG: hypothetical protein HY850_08345 [Betaproteobacteria bacterium]|nr:hypothetical protein [Betaproteobacteria bacterium]